MRILPTFIAIALTLLCQQSSAAPNAQSLQQLIDQAPAGGEVKVPRGTSGEPITISKPLTLRGEDRDACIIEVVSDKPAIQLAHPQGEAVLENLTVRWKLATSNRGDHPQAA